jgi:multimeric flavodoxin WrbA
MAKIVAILASPRRKGNSEAIVDAVTDGAMGLSTNEISLYRLDSMHYIRGCKACMRCKTEGECIQSDELSDLLKIMKEADGIIVSVPVYFGGACAQYKMLEDRMNSFFDSDLKPVVSTGKDVTIIVTYSVDADAANLVADNIENVFVKMLGCNLLGRIVYCDRGSADSAANDDALLTEAKNIGRKMRNN